MIEREFKIRNALKYLDLTETEITVYLGLLQTGNIPASMLAKRLNFNRSTTRYTLEKLHQKELVIQYEKNNTFYFVVENLEKILQIFKQEKAVINKKEKVIGDVLNDLKNLQNAHANMPKVQFFEGVNEVKKSLFDIIKDTKKGGQLIEYVSPMHFDTEQKQESCAMQKEIKIVVDIFMTERLKKNITLDVILPESPYSKIFAETDQQKLRRVFFTKIQDPLLEESEPTAIILSENKMLSIVGAQDSIFSFMVEQKQIIKIYYSIFQFLIMSGKQF